MGTCNEAVRLQEKYVRDRKACSNSKIVSGTWYRSARVIVEERISENMYTA